MPGVLETAPGQQEELRTIGCNCGDGAVTTKYEVTTAQNSSPVVFLSLTEAEIRVNREGGGTIRRIQ